MAASPQLNQLLAKATQHLQAQQWDKADRVLRKALKQSPNDPDILQRLGGVQRRLGQPKKAMDILERAMTAAPENTLLASEYAEAMLDLGRTSDAIEWLGRAIGSHPDDTGLLALRGRIRYQLGDLHGACDDCRAASALAPDDLELLARWIDAMIADGSAPMDDEPARRLVERQPFSTRNHSRLGSVHRLNGSLDEAMDCYRRSIELDTTNSDAIAGMAEVHEARGDSQAAVDLLAPHVHTTGAAFPVLTAWLRSMFRLKQWDDAARTAMAWIDAAPRSSQQTALIHHRIGNAYDRAGRPDEAFDAWRRGNEPHANAWDADEHTRLTDSLIETYSSRMMDEHPRSSRTDTRPVFIMGMFRSGTTLLEQIISMHPTAHAAGERSEMLELAGSLRTATGSNQPYPQCVAETTDEHLDAAAATYLQALASGAGDATIITDKLPLNFLNIGLISLMLPGARIIHSNRDPLDTCLSCYGNSFSSRMTFTANLEHLGRAYRDYIRIMEHWRSVRTVPMLEVDYESIASDPEPQIRRILEFLEIPWDDACMQFHRSKRVAQTLSREQVKQPMYTRSIHRSRAYWDQLEPLRAVLGDLAPDDPDH